MQKYTASSVCAVNAPENFTYKLAVGNFGKHVSLQPYLQVEMGRVATFIWAQVL